MTLELEPYSIRRSIHLGPDIYQLVAEEREWLEDMFPGTVRRYRSPLHSVRNIARVAREEQLKAFVVRKDKIARGIATAIFDQTIIHPTIGSFRGTDLDYWLAADSTESEHDQVAFKLMLASEQLHGQRTTNDGYNLNQSKIAAPHHTIMGTIGKSDPNPSVGLLSIMESVGTPEVLTTPDGNDEFGITKDGKILQLYIDRTTLQGSL